jgi:hypothetical protein
VESAEVKSSAYFKEISREIRWEDEKKKKYIFVVMLRTNNKYTLLLTRRVKSQESMWETQQRLEP